MEDPNGNQDRLTAVEKKITLLVSLGIAQTVLLVVILAMLFMDQLLPSWSTLIMLALFIGLAAYVFRRQLPGIFGYVSRFIFSRLSSTQKQGSNKDIF